MRICKFRKFWGFAIINDKKNLLVVYFYSIDQRKKKLLCNRCAHKYYYDTPWKKIPFCDLSPKLFFLLTLWTWDRKVFSIEFWWRKKSSNWFFFVYHKKKFLLVWLNDCTYYIEWMANCFPKKYKPPNTTKNK